ncbi:hypothetical protein Zmor_002046 [Zophobas morio]|uniref:Uncharacterized protein n=1 Tax=Zophobas morio TaxID=2755281 RepID=A0AA38J6S1_9CUCU|nr:hypothetical protein Zmor_002046 [Zophobas morio]
MNLVNIVTKRIFRGPETVTRTARAGGKSTIAAPEEEDSCLKLQGVRKCCGCFPKSDFEVQSDPPTTVSTFLGRLPIGVPVFELPPPESGGACPEESQEERPCRTSYSYSFFL